MNNEITAVVQVRMGSSRLPGKVMKFAEGKPLLGHLISRLQQCKHLNSIVISTSINTENDIIENYCLKREVSCYRGNEEDTLGRMIGALSVHNTNIGVQVYGDGPLIDPKIVDHAIELYIKNASNFDFVSNDIKTSYPPGMEVEVFSVSALQDSNAKVRNLGEREHSTLHIRTNPEKYRLLNFEAPEEFTRPDLNIEVDTAEDFIIIEKILYHFRNNQEFGIGEIIRFLDDNPEIKNLNKEVPRRWTQYRQ